MGHYTRYNTNVSCKEESSRRAATGLNTTNPAASGIFPLDDFEEFDFDEPVKDFQEFHPINQGRNVGKIGDKGYPTKEITIEMQMQTGIWLYYVLGGIDNTGASAPYTHAITEADLLPTFAMRIEQLLASNNIVKDLIGCHIKKVLISIKKDETVKLTITMVVPKSVDMVSMAFASRPTNFTDEIFTFAQATLPTFTMDSEDMKAWNIESMDIDITNELELLPVMGDAYKDAPKLGKRDYEVKVFIYPEKAKLRVLRDTIPSTYTGSLVVKITRGATDYVQLTFSNLYVAEYPNKVPNVEDSEVGVDCVLKNNAGGTLAVEVKDTRAAAYY